VKHDNPSPTPKFNTAISPSLLSNGSHIPRDGLTLVISILPFLRMHVPIAG
jgi:hypothetical protein